MSRIVILGGGESGVGAAILAKHKGFDVFLSDQGILKPSYAEELANNNIHFEHGKHSEELILSADEVIKSPGIPDDAPVTKRLIERNIPIVSEIEFAGRYTNAKMICITGSNGKTTTTSLIYHMLKEEGLNVGLGGNIGKSIARQVAMNNFDYYVLELSSFQLDNMYKFHASIAILLNITPDHLDRYKYKMENYAKSKLRIAQNMTKYDSFIYCLDDEVTKQYLNEANIKANMLPFSIKQQVEQGAFFNENKITAMYEKQQFSMLVEELALKGKHNLYNSMAASIAGQVLRIRKETIRESLSNFKSIEHRLEPVLKVGGILFINDSKATNINSTWYALESMTAPTIWIVGGKDKGNDYSELTKLVKEKVKAIVCLGLDNSKIHKAFEGIVDTIVDTKSAEEAVKAAYKLGEKGDTVLLSPACASFDLFKNYEDRGRQFKESVRNL
ncbi:MAG: UDP-N-acetylmuramoyl-L-alanine--D-glutamate ligase [Prevotellaceae bacterium]|jgi:UDP-N-acetylmuramoylalanine--D-glutamate ligase|nr:UDP-N-acetylmuramoyl-L-alanine--D-glutamate ligase [Prevotellaceae bacterium]